MLSRTHAIWRKCDTRPEIANFSRQPARQAQLTRAIRKRCAANGATSHVLDIADGPWHSPRDMAQAVPYEPPFPSIFVEIRTFMRDRATARALLYWQQHGVHLRV
jgi:hypothetical protein